MDLFRRDVSATEAWDEHVLPRSAVCWRRTVGEIPCFEAPPSRRSQVHKTFWDLLTACPQSTYLRLKSPFSRGTLEATMTVEAFFPPSCCPWLVFMYSVTGWSQCFRARNQKDNIPGNSKGWVRKKRAVINRGGGLRSGSLNTVFKGNGQRYGIMCHSGLSVHPPIPSVHWLDREVIRRPGQRSWKLLYKTDTMRMRHPSKRHGFPRMSLLFQFSRYLHPLQCQWARSKGVQRSTPWQNLGM